MLLLASCGQLSLGGTASADGKTTRSGSSGPSSSSSGPSSAAAPSGSAHDKLSVLDVKIGMEIERPGYTCMKDKLTASGERVDRHCVKFVDERCKGRPTNLGQLRYGEKAPMGCYLDTGGATYLDNLLMQDPHTGATDQAHNGRTPLTNVHLIGTESTPSKIYNITYTMPWDDLLSESSKLHKALVAKYGEPREIHGWMRWKIDSTELKVRCERTECSIDVNDRKFEENVESEQEEADTQKKRDTAPAPEL